LERVLVHLVADYGHGDLAFAEVHQRLAALLDATVVPTPVAPFDTLAAGFCIAQLALNDGPAERVVFHNVAPRQDAFQPRDQNEGERLVALELESGVLVVGPNAGNSLSFVREHAAWIRYVEAPASGSQFRSRDFFPKAVAELASGGRDLLGDDVEPADMPPVPEQVIAYVDGYGNLKTTFTQAPAAAGERVLVRIGGIAAPAIVSDGTFDVAEGELAFAPGSSGWGSKGAGETRFYELFLRGASAAARFSHPTIGSPIEIAKP